MIKHIDTSFKKSILLAGILVFSMSQIFAETDLSSPSSTTVNSQKNTRIVVTYIRNFFSMETFTPEAFKHISGIRTYPKNNIVLITWVADTLATSQIYYDTTTPVVIASSTLHVAASDYGTYANSKGTIRSLTASTTYYFRIIAEDRYGEVFLSKEMSFMTSE